MEGADRLLKKGASHPISRELVISNHELTRAKLVSVPVFQQPAEKTKNQKAGARRAPIPSGFF
jgi:hypothetical protein